MRNCSVTWCLLLIIGASTACAPDFDSPSKVTDLRVLAIQMNPPEFIYPSDLVGLPTEEAFQMMNSSPVSIARILVANPLDPDALLEYRVEGCLLGNDFYCADSPTPTLYGDGASQPGILEVSTYFTSTHIEAIFDAAPASGFFGAAAWVTGEVWSPDESVTFLKSQLFSPNYGGVRTVNENPSLDDVLLGEKDEELPIVVQPDGYWETLTSEEYRLLPVIPKDDHQSYVVMTFSLEHKEITEEMTVRFFGTCGDFQDESKTEVLDILFETKEDIPEKSLATTWTAPKEPINDCTLWFVVTDGRGGVGWWTQKVRVK
jgi:hypothetical protein